MFMTIAAVMSVSAVFADSSSVTSKRYVDDFMAGYQDKVPGSGADKLMIYDESPDGIGEKNIVSSLGESTSATDVPNVGAVKAGMDGKQDTINGTAGYVMTGMGTNRPGEVGERAIYGTAVYSNSLVTAETVNTGVTNAVNSSLIRVDANGNPSDTGTLWEINTDLYAIGVLPPGYTQLEWIRSSGTQYIDTGQALDTSTDDIELVFQPTEIGGNGNNIFGARNTTSSNAYTFGLSTGSYYRLGWGNSTINADLMGDTNKHTLRIEHNGGVFKLDGNVISELGNVAITTPNNATLFIVRNPSHTYAGYAKIYEYKKWRNGALVQHFIPASKVENNETIVGMYDTVSGTFFTDAAGGTFTAGPAVGN